MKSKLFPNRRDLFIFVLSRKNSGERTTRRAKFLLRPAHKRTKKSLSPRRSEKKHPHGTWTAGAKKIKKWLAMEILCATIALIFYLKRINHTNMTEESKKKNVAEITFTETEALGRYVTETGKILPRKFTGLTSKEQRHVKKTVKHARNMLLMK